ncbi:hypothetical protein, conserved [Leishmania tarentolae]|uniref:Uncharacterized protein n=1 Tax=Leishmania tarentolae TaxID=5689 RepID=A0A640KW06_LEITA|nr:hypothetical protein, conserved [Leishmania tarentolae]
MRMDAAHIESATTILHATARQALRLPDAVVVIRHIVPVALRIAVHGHHIICPPLKLWHVLVTAVLCEVAKLLLAVARIGVECLFHAFSSFQLGLLHSAISVVLSDTVFYDALCGDNGAHVGERRRGLRVAHAHRARGTAHSVTQNIFEEGMGAEENRKHHKKVYCGERVGDKPVWRLFFFFLRRA